MKKRIACLLLALVMLVGLVPLSAVRASAAGYGVSSAGVRVIKEYVGFHKNAYAVGNSYRIGYGTPGVKDATITEANADKLLREELDTIAGRIHTALGGAPLVQHRIDALVWYTKTEGDQWLTDGNAANFREAVKNGTSGSAMANLMCTWYFDAYGFSNSATDRQIVTNRMYIANLYLTGTYAAKNTGSLAFTVFDAGDNASIAGKRLAVQVYSGNAKQIAVLDPTKGSQQFLGWYLDGQMITGLGSNTAGKTLTAKWQETSHSVGAEYSLAAEVIYTASGNKNSVQMNIYEKPDEGSAVINVLNRQTTVLVVGEKMIGDIKWLKLSTGGWVKLGKLEDIPASLTNQTVTVNDDYVNIRQEPSATSAKLGTAKRGEQLTITMLSDDGKWGYCSKGWVFLAYTTYGGNSAPASSGGAAAVSGTPGVVTGAAKVNVRKGAGVGNALATTLAEGTAVTVYERTTVDGASWGRIDQGWISLGYVKLQEVQKPVDGSSISTGSSAVVSSSVSLNVRSGPGTIYEKVSTLAPGTSVVILRKETVNGATWGLIDQGWINLSYVTATASSGSGSESVYSVGGTVVNCATGVNVRAAAGTNNALVGVAGVGTRVNVSDITTVGGFKWGKIDSGWVCMDYIQLDSEFSKPAATTPNVEDEPSNVVEFFQGYPATVNAGGAALRDAQTGKQLMVLKENTQINILAMDGTSGKVTVGDKTGWVSMDLVTMKEFNAKVTASKADVYEEPSTRSKFYASLVNGTYITIPAGNANWKVSDGSLWGNITVTTSGVTYKGWLKLADVTMFKGNVTPTGITTYSGVGYLTGSVNTNTTIIQDENGNVSQITTMMEGQSNIVNDVPTNYTLTAGTRVNILSRNYVLATGVTYGKVTAGSVTGWIPMENVTLDPVTMEVKAATSGAPDVGNAVAVGVGQRVTILKRELTPFGAEVNHGVIDRGYGYIGDNTSVNYWFILDDGKLAPVGNATVEDPGNPAIASSVVLTGKAVNPLNIREETIDSTDPNVVKQLLQVAAGTPVTILNWKNVDGITWGKVQINKVVGWVKAEEVDFTGLKGQVAVDALSLYTLPDTSSAVQILRVNAKPVSMVGGQVLLSGNILWGQINIDGIYSGWADLSKLKLNTPGISTGVDEDNLPVMAKGKINSINITVNVEDGQVVSLPKSTEVSLIDLSMTMTPGKAMWKVDLGDKDG